MTRNNTCGTVVGLVLSLPLLLRGGLAHLLGTAQRRPRRANPSAGAVATILTSARGLIHVHRCRIMAKPATIRLDLGHQILGFVIGVPPNVGHDPARFREVENCCRAPNSHHLRASGRVALWLKLRKHEYDVSLAHILLYGPV